MTHPAYCIAFHTRPTAGGQVRWSLYAYAADADGEILDGPNTSDRCTEGMAGSQPEAIASAAVALARWDMEADNA